MLLMAIALGCIWHGALIVWVAPKPSQFAAERSELEKGSPAAFMRFWLDQYAWIGIGLVAFGVAILLWQLVS